MFRDVSDNPSSLCFHGEAVILCSIKLQQEEYKVETNAREIQHHPEYSKNPILTNLLVWSENEFEFWVSDKLPRKCSILN